MSDVLPASGAQLLPRPVGPFMAEALIRYAQVSGDDNPLHTDPVLAAKAGLAAPPVQGMLMMGALEPELLHWQPHLSLSRLAVKFVRPVLAGEGITLSGRVVQRRETEITMRLMAHNSARDMVMLAEATLKPLSEA
jgi:3-hydroxybutyryl-CoA dehydratase